MVQNPIGPMPPGRYMTMRTFSPIVLCLAVLAVVAAPAAAVQGPDRGPRPEIDVRAGGEAAVPAKTEAARSRLENRLGGEGDVETDLASGGVRSIARTDGFLTPPANGDEAAVALAYVRDRPDVFGLDAADLRSLRLVARYRGPDGVTHLTWQQTSRGIVAYDSTLSVNLTADGRVLNVTGAPAHNLDLPTARPKLSASRALSVALRDVGGRLLPPAVVARGGPDRRTRFANGATARLVAFADPRGDRLAWRLSVAGEDPYAYDEVVDAATGDVLARHTTTSFVSNASVYDQFPGAPGAAGTPHTVDLSADPQWLSRAGTPPVKLDGRNAHAYADVTAPNGFQAGEDIAPSAGPDWLYPQQSVVCAAGRSPSTFSGRCTWDGTSVATEPTNRAQTTTQLFYFVNTFHDWLAQSPIGFTDASHNFELGGAGGDDPVNAEADDSSGFNNANMSTGADGSSPRMQMYLFNSPAVNSGDDATIVYHEYTHGLSNRLVGNGTGNALTAKQSRAMGEGWSDWYAMDYLVGQGFNADTGADGDVVLGSYATNNTVTGIRRGALDCAPGVASAGCPGTPSAGPGGFTLGDMGRVGTRSGVARFQVHNDGELWAQTLWDIRKTLGPVTARGLVTNGMRLSVVNPSMLDMRDAILLADKAAGGADHDALWTIFAARGMGFGAAVTSANSTRARQSLVTPTTTAAAGTPSYTESDAALGDADGVAEPGETIKLKIPLRDLSPAAITGTTGKLSASTPGVVVGQPTVSYGTVPGLGSVTPAATFAVTISSSTPCATHLALNLAVASSAGAENLPVDLPLGGRSGLPLFSAPGLPASVPDNNPTGITVDLGIATAKTIDTLRVRVAASHTYFGDLSADLTSPSGRVIELFERPGFGPAGSDGNGFDVTFDDAATTPFQNRPSSGDGIPSGSFKPNEPLSAFAGDQLSGTWKLHVWDGFSGDVGSLTAFEIEAADPVCSTATAPTLPDAATTEPAGLTGTAATLIGTIDPRGTTTGYAFEYGPSTAYGTQTTEGSAGSGSGPAAQTTGISGLTPGATYHYRMLALRSGIVIARGADQTFTSTSGPPAPVAATGAASAITSTAATLAGTVDSLGTQTEYAFQYGLDASYGIQTTPASSGNATGATTRTQPVAGLAASTLYHFRIVALRGSSVIATGADATFTTLASGGGGGGSPTPTPTPSSTPTPTPTPSPTPTPTAIPTFAAPPLPAPPLPAPPVTEPSISSPAKTLKLSRAGRGTFAFVALPAGGTGRISFKSDRKGIAFAKQAFTVPANSVLALKVKASKRALRRLQQLNRRALKAKATIRLDGRTFVLPITVKVPARRR